MATNQIDYKEKNQKIEEVYKDFQSKVSQIMQQMHKEMDDFKIKIIKETLEKS